MCVTYVVTESCKKLCGPGGARAIAAGDWPFRWNARCPNGTPSATHDPPPGRPRRATKQTSIANSHATRPCFSGFPACSTHTDRAPIRTPHHDMVLNAHVGRDGDGFKPVGADAGWLGNGEHQPRVYTKLSQGQVKYAILHRDIPRTSERCTARYLPSATFCAAVMAPA